MGYACPVCGDPQVDGEHLAHHIAFAAMLHGGDHEAWLDGRVPDWADRDPEGLAAAVVEHAEETDHGPADGDATGDRPDIGHTHVRGHGATADGRHESGRELDPEVRRIVEEAIEMTRRRRPGGDGDERREGDAEE